MEEKETQFEKRIRAQYEQLATEAKEKAPKLAFEEIIRSGVSCRIFYDYEDKQRRVSCCWIKDKEKPPFIQINASGDYPYSCKDAHPNDYIRLFYPDTNGVGRMDYKSSINGMRKNGIADFLGKIGVDLGEIKLEPVATPHYEFTWEKGSASYRMK